MKLTKLSAAWLRERTCRLMPAPAGWDAGTASQLIPGVRRTVDMTGTKRTYSAWALRLGLASGLLRLWFLRRRAKRLGGAISNRFMADHHRCLCMRYRALAQHYRGCGRGRRARDLDHRARIHAAQAILHARWHAAEGRRGPRRSGEDDGPGVLAPVRPRPRMPDPLTAAATLEPADGADEAVHAVALLGKRVSGAREPSNEGMHQTGH